MPALTSPGVAVTITDESQYLPAPTSSVPLVIIATAQNKADPTSTGVAQASTAANAGKLFQVTSQRDLVTLYGNPFFYTTTTGTPIQGYELNEYGLLAAYSLLGVTNRCYVLRADIDLASLVGQTGRPTSDPADGTYWLDTTTSTWGINEFNATTGKFTYIEPALFVSGVNGRWPLNSEGSIGDYAVNPNQGFSTPNASPDYFYKLSSNYWTKLGSADWLAEWPTVQCTEASPDVPSGTLTIGLNGNFTTAIAITAHEPVAVIASSINALGWTYLSATVVNGKLCLMSKQTQIAASKYITIAGDAPLLAELGISAGSYNQPEFTYGTSAQMPVWQAGQTSPRPTGSVWIKTSSVASGLSVAMSEFSSLTAGWIPKNVTLAESNWAAIAALDSTGGKEIPAGTVYAQYGFAGTFNEGPIYMWKRAVTGPTVVTGTNTAPSFTAGPYTATIRVSVPGSTGLSSPYTFTLADDTHATDFVTAWSASGAPYTYATVTSDGAIQIVHTEGGDIVFDDPLATGLPSGVWTAAGLTTPYKLGPNTNITYSNVAGTASGAGIDATLNVTKSYNTYTVDPVTFGNAGTLYTIGDTITILGTSLGGGAPTHNLVVRVTAVGGGGEVEGVTFVSGAAAFSTTSHLISNWELITYVANEGALVTKPLENTNWFYSVVDEVDIMVNYNGGWKGYAKQNYDVNGFPTPTGVNATDPAGPIVSASEPTTQSDGTVLVYGDLWIDTSDLENYPVISRWQRVSTVDQWVLLDNSNQTDSNGVLFADARWATNDTTSVSDDPIPTIVSLLASNYLDLDAPEPSLSPTGMLLFNTRRSGYNVKQFKINYFSNTNFPGAILPTETDAWLSASGLQSNGSPFMGRKAQRAMVVESLRSVVDTNSDIRDEDNFFNLIAAPNYPELQPNMVVLNSDRGETAYIIGDTPLGLSDSATDIQAWATNAALATSTGEEGCVTRNTYLGLFYPSGMASDLSGNLVAVPASHMMLRTFLKNDTQAYPWLAAAGTRRGIIDNATNIGYVNRNTGEFQVIKTRIGVRDVLYINMINPLVFFTGNGLLNYGNKTSYNSSSALDRTNVARLVAYVRRQLTLAARPFVFEPNDSLTRQQIAGVVETLFIDLVAKRGVYDYLVVCDNSNNTPARIDRSELWIDVAIEPVKAAEFIFIPVRILNTGELSAA